MTVTNSSGCTASATAVIINPLPTPTAGNNGLLCSGLTLNLTSSVMAFLTLGLVKFV
ncbi:MAG: hypothetical protein U5N85_00215 [Arcicella sp.]|nr:hypothetical protein [Arcicella sp.]